MVQTKTNWLSSGNESEQIDTNSFSETGNDNYLVQVEDTPLPSPVDYDVPTSLLVPTLHQPDEAHEPLDSLDLNDINEIYATGDFARLHPYLENGSLVTLPKEQLVEFMAQMSDNMVLMNGLNTLAEVIKPLVQESEEGKALVSFMAKNANLFTGKEIDFVEGIKLLTALPSLIGHFKTLMSKVDINLLKDNADFMKDFRMVLQRNNSPFLSTIHTLGNSVTQLKP